jgi:flavin reductase (DIM6/NTAB) family NADH-FMN oxidoreductase RutF
MKTKLGAQRMLFPLPTILVVTGDMQEANIITLAWVSLLSGNPPTIGLSIGMRGVSGDMILKNNDFTVNIVSANHMIEADFCGITSGDDTDKFKETGFTKIESSIIQSPIIKECPVNMECKLIEHKIVGTTNHFIGEIVETHIDSDKIEDPAIAKSLNIEAINPLIYISGLQEYRKLGDKIGDAYKIGSKLFNK